MALDADNPRAILFLIRAMRIHAQALPRASLNGRPSELLRTILPLEARLTCAHPDEITSDDLQGIRAELADVSDLLSSIYLR